MNPYPKGLGSEVYAQSAPTSAGKVATHFNSPYMKAISQNLMTAIYGSPQDELTRQRIEQSKLAMQQTEQEMDLAASQGEARTQLGALLADPKSYGENGDLRPEARAAASQLNLQSGGRAGDFFIQTGQFGRDKAKQDDAQAHDVSMQEDRQLHDIAQANTRHLNDIYRLGLSHDYDKELADIRGQQSINEILTRFENDKVLKTMQNDWQAGENATDRLFDATTTALDYTENMQTTPQQLGSVFELMGITPGENMLQNLSEATPYPTSSGNQSLVPFKRMYDFAFAQGITEGMGEAEAVAELSRVASAAIELISANPQISEAEAVQRVIQMGNAPQSTDGIWKIELKN